MKLFIRKKHTKDTSFDAIHDDALTQAMKEQYPEVKLKSVFSDFFTDHQGRQYIFDTSESTGYCRRSFNRLQSGEIIQIELMIVEDELQHRRNNNSGAVNPGRLNKREYA